MSKFPAEHKSKINTTLIKYTSQTNYVSFSDVDITQYDGFQILIGSGSSGSTRCTTFVPNTSSFLSQIVRVPLFTMVGSSVEFSAYADVDFVNKTMKTSNSSYYVYLFGVTINS